MRQWEEFIHKTKNRFFSVFMMVILTVPLGAAARNLCPYDTTGLYNYLPVFVFYGDGQITHDSSLYWYIDDVATCYQTHLTPGYLKYFPKCDLNGDGTVAVSEVYDIYDRVHPKNQNDTVAASACMEAFEGESFFFCTSASYDRTAADISAIMSQYPATETIFEPQAMTAGQLPKLHSFFDLSCTTSTGAFSKSAFDALNECYLASSQCGTGCSTVHISFSQPTNTLKTVDEYNAVAASFGGTCSRVVGNTFDGAAPGFHYAPDQAESAEWNWQVRSTAECQGTQCDCDITYEFTTSSEELGSVILISETNNTNASCTDARFPVEECPYDCFEDGLLCLFNSGTLHEDLTCDGGGVCCEVVPLEECPSEFTCVDDPFACILDGGGEHLTEYECSAGGVCCDLPGQGS